MPIEKLLSQQEFRSSEGQNTENGNAPTDSQQPRDLFLQILKYGQRLLPDQPCFKGTKPHLTKFDGFIRHFYVHRETNENQILEARRGGKNPAFSLSLYHSFLIKQLSNPPGWNSDHIPGSEGKTPTEKAAWKEIFGSQIFPGVVAERSLLEHLRSPADN